MSEPPRVELNNTATDFDLSAPPNQFQQTFNSTSQDVPQTNSDHFQQSNGNSTQNLQDSAVRAKDSLVDSEVSGIERFQPFAELQPNAIHHSLICHFTRHPVFPTHTHKAASQAMSAANDHPAVQNAKQTVLNGEVSAIASSDHPGATLTLIFRYRIPSPPAHAVILTVLGPVAQNVKAEGAKTRDEFADLANSRAVPDHKAATGQNLTRKQSLESFLVTA